MRRYVLSILAALAALGLSYAQVSDPVTLKERASVSPSGHYVTYAPPSMAPTYPDLEKITHLSTAVLTGMVVDNRTELSPDGNFINVVYKVAVQGLLKGQGLRAGDQIKVSLPGGKYQFKTPDGSVVSAEVRTPWFKKMVDGKTYYLFLTVASSEARTADDVNVSVNVVLGPTGGPQGVFELVDGVVKSNSGRLRDPAWQYHNLPENTFVDLIRGALSRDPSCAPPFSCAQ